MKKTEMHITQDTHTQGCYLAGMFEDCNDITHHLDPHISQYLLGGEWRGGERRGVGRGGQLLEAILKCCKGYIGRETF